MLETSFVIEHDTSIGTLILLTTVFFQVAILEYKSIICAGYSAVLHIHTCAEEVAIKVSPLTCCTLDV
jgi:translation elongation factor EF-1alpha